MSLPAREERTSCKAWRVGLDASTLSGNTAPLALVARSDLF